MGVSSRLAGGGESRGEASRARMAMLCCAAALRARARWKVSGSAIAE